VAGIVGTGDAALRPGWLRGQTDEGSDFVGSEIQ
jgi:hypothetical protein